jgi:PAS domain S-box-containing protein
VDYITKPFQAEEVLARVRIHLDLRELTERLEHRVAERTDALHRTNAQLQRELTERKQAEAALRQSETLLNATQRLANVGGWEWDVEKQVTFWTEETYRIHGFAPQTAAAGLKDAIERSLDCYDPADRSIISAAFERCLEKGEGYDLEFAFTAADGRRKWIRTTATALREQGRVVKVVGNIMDITLRKRTEIELARYRDHLEELVEARTAELEGFTYSVSHDLRAPLRHIDGFIELLQNSAGSVLNQQSQHYMGNISRAARKMGQLVDDLLSFSRMGRHAVTMTPVDLGLLVREVLHYLEPDSAGRTIDWCIGDLPVVKGDAAMLRIVLVNQITPPKQVIRLEKRGENL